MTWKTNPYKGGLQPGALVQHTGTLLADVMWPVGMSDVISLTILSVNKGITKFISENIGIGENIGKIWLFETFLPNLVVMPRNEFLEFPGIIKE